MRTPTVVKVDVGRPRHLPAGVLRPGLVPRHHRQHRPSRSTCCASRCATTGAITAAVYSTDDKVLDAAEEAALDAGVALSENLTETVYVNQSAAFSDFHATGANPAANSALTDAAYVASRFRIVQSRRHLPARPLNLRRGRTPPPK